MPRYPSNKTEQKIGRLMVDWFAKNQRVLPWRIHTSVYRRLVSEFMLQQTQVATVIPYFNRWIERFPSIDILAKASEAQVLKAWEGLGYYARAKNLHRTAQKIVEQQINLTDPERFAFPKAPQDWQMLPGIGDYTAHALAAIAQNQRVAAIDGNVIRVLCRINGVQQIFENKDQAVNYIKNIAHLYIPLKKSSAYNEAVMELGAVICKPKNPCCFCCPIEGHCCSFQTKLDVAHIPQFQKKIYIQRTIQRIFVESNQRILLKKASGKRLCHILELPLVEDMPEEISMEVIAGINRSISRERINEVILEPKERIGDLDLWLQKNRELVLLPFCELENATLSGPHRRWLEKKLKL
ncbi:MAG: hypothetical protein LBB11_03930 [Puniceicoccales bacterium]|jgi:A/G-specific adenine glycosylase|nr:hypothetical protein [Puniceicoccales bacterium]